MQFYMNFTDARRNNLGQSFKSLVKECIFNERDCLNEKFVSIYLPKIRLLERERAGERERGYQWFHALSIL